MSRAGASAALAGVGLFLLAACGDEPQIEPPIVMHPDVQSELSYARGEGPVLAVVDGEAFPGAGPAVRQAALAAVQGGPPGANVTFTLDPAAAGQAERRLVIAFNPPTAVDGGALCGGEQVGRAAQADGGVALAAAFCNGPRPLSWVRGRAPGLRDATDPDFRELVRVAMRELFPQRER